MNNAELWQGICQHVVNKVISAHGGSNTTAGDMSISKLLENKGEFVALVVKTMLDDMNKMALQNYTPDEGDIPSRACDDLRKANTLKKQLRSTLAEVRELRMQLRDEFDNAGFDLENMIANESTEDGLDMLQAQVGNLEKTLMPAM